MRGRRDLPSSSGSSSGANTKKKSECCWVVYNRRRVKQVDIISHLPQDILHHIFTFLDIKQAIQTCILSRRWRYFWVSLPILKFNYMKAKGCRNQTNRNEFMGFVDRVLMIRGNSNIHEFVLVTENDCIDVTDRLNTWILVCFLRNVQQLTLDTYIPENFQFHQFLLTCKSLTKLVLRANYNNRVSFSLPDSVTLPRLKTLSLDSVKFEDEYSTNRLFSGCPILESLTLRWEFPYTLDDLKPVVVDNDNYMSTCCDLKKNFRFLVKADLNVCVDDEWSEKEKAMYALHMVNILRQLHNVEDLTLSASFLEVISGSPDLFDRQSTKFCNLRCLKLEGEWHSIDYIHGISYLLKISPNIDTLSIELEYCEDFWESPTYLLDMQPTQFCNLRCLKMHTLLSRDWICAITYLLKICPNTETLSYTVYPDEERDYFSYNNFYCDEMNSDPTIKRYFGEAGLSLECLLNNLKCFVLRDVTGRIDELELLQILLKNAIVLEKLLIVFAGKCGCFKKCRCVLVRKKFSNNVLTFPRASPSVVILFKL